MKPKDDPYYCAYCGSNTPEGCVSHEHPEDCECSICAWIYDNGPEAA